MVIKADANNNSPKNCKNNAHPISVPVDDGFSTILLTTTISMPNKNNDSNICEIFIIVAQLPKISNP